MGEIPKHWEDIIRSKPPVIDDGSFYYTKPEPLGESGYSFRFLMETVDGAHNLPAGLYVETDIPKEEFEADINNLYVLVGNDVCLQLRDRNSQQSIPTGQGSRIDIGSTVRLQYEGFNAVNGGVVFRLHPVEVQAARDHMQAVVNGQKQGYVMRGK